MSRLAGRTPKGLGPTLRASASVGARRPTCLALALGTVPAMARYSSTENNNLPRSTGPSFKGQLTHSIMKRLAQEREDLERLARTRPQSSAAKNFTLTFGRDGIRDRVLSLAALS
jgi:D-lactate dehydrogenase (cytochrome)